MRDQPHVKGQRLDMQKAGLVREPALVFGRTKRPEALQLFHTGMTWHEKTGHVGPADR